MKKSFHLPQQIWLMLSNKNNGWSDAVANCKLVRMLDYNQTFQIPKQCLSDSPAENLQENNSEMLWKILYQFKIHAQFFISPILLQQALLFFTTAELIIFLAEVEDYRSVTLRYNHSVSICYLKLPSPPQSVPGPFLPPSSTPPKKAPTSPVSPALPQAFLHAVNSFSLIWQSLQDLAPVQPCEDPNVHLLLSFTLQRH